MTPMPTATRLSVDQLNGSSMLTGTSAEGRGGDD